MIQGVVTSADAHVASLVNRQSSKKKPAKTAKMPPARRPNTMQRPWQPPTPSQPFQRQNYQNRYEFLYRGFDLVFMICKKIKGF